MTIRVLSEGWRNQYDRMRRARTGLVRAHRAGDQYDDAFYHAVQDAWHLRDWIGKDTTLSRQLRADICREAEENEAIGIVGDLAMGSGRMTPEFMVAMKNGESRSGIVILDGANRAWDEILTRYKLL